MSGSRVQFFYDFVDPLSYLTGRQLRAVPGLTDEDVSWHPLELRPPPTPLVSVDDESLAPRWKEARRLLRELAPPELVPWTRKAHELVLYAAEHDLADAVRDRLFEAYLLEGSDIGRVDVLVELGATLGLDRTETKAVLDVDRHEADVAALRADALSAGIRQTPTLVIGEERLEGFHNRDRIGTLLGT